MEFENGDLENFCLVLLNINFRLSSHFSISRSSWNCLQWWKCIVIFYSEVHCARWYNDCIICRQVNHKILWSSLVLVLLYSLGLVRGKFKLMTWSLAASSYILPLSQKGRWIKWGRLSLRPWILVWWVCHGHAIP